MLRGVSVVTKVRNVGWPFDAESSSMAVFGVTVEVAVIVAIRSIHY